MPMTRRGQLVDMRVGESNRLEQAPKRAARSILGVLKTLDDELLPELRHLQRRQIIKLVAVAASVARRTNLPRNETSYRGNANPHQHAFKGLARWPHRSAS